MSSLRRSVPRAPAIVRLFDPMGRWLLRQGVPMGPDTLMTIVGRKTGRPRTVGVAVEEIGGRRFVVGTYGDVNWVRNLRAAGEAVILVRGRPERVAAVELPPGEAAAFFRDVLGPYIRGLPLALRGITLLLMRFGGARQIIDDPEGAARSRPVFELHTPR